MHTILLKTEHQRQLAKRLIDKAPAGWRVRIEAPKRTLEQNDRLWAMLSDVSRAMPEGRRHTPEVWKTLFMHAHGHDVRFEIGLNGEPFPVGLSTSKLTKQQCSDLMEFIAVWGSERGVEWSD